MRSLHLLTLFTLLACLASAAQAREETLAPRPEVALVRINFFVTRPYCTRSSTSLFVQDAVTRDLMERQLHKGTERRKGRRHVVMQGYFKAGTYNVLEYKNSDQRGCASFPIRRSFTITADDYGREVVIAEIDFNNELTVESTRLATMQ